MGSPHYRTPKGAACTYPQREGVPFIAGYEPLCLDPVPICVNSETGPCPREGRVNELAQIAVLCYRRSESQDSKPLVQQYSEAFFCV